MLRADTLRDAEVRRARRQAGGVALRQRSLAARYSATSARRQARECQRADAFERDACYAPCASRRPRLLVALRALSLARYFGVTAPYLRCHIRVSARERSFEPNADDADAAAVMLISPLPLHLPLPC